MTQMVRRKALAIWIVQYVHLAPFERRVHLCEKVQQTVQARAYSCEMSEGRLVAKVCGDCAGGDHWNSPEVGLKKKNATCEWCLENHVISDFTVKLLFINSVRNNRKRNWCWICVKF